MKYINQLDYPHWLYVTKTDMEEPFCTQGKTTTIRSSGCGLCCAIMVADRLLPNCEFGLTEAISLSYEVKANYHAGTSYVRFAPAFAEKMGLRYERSSNMEDIQRCLRTGGAVVVLVGGNREDHTGLFSRGGHYITVIGEEPDGRFAILDPSYKPGKFDEEGRQGKVEIRNDVIVLCDPKDLAEDASVKYTPFFLFWRQ